VTTDASGDAVPGVAAAEWQVLRDEQLWARAIRITREDLAFFKSLFETYEGVALIRTVETRSDGSAVIAILATEDFRGETDAILADIAARGAPAFTAVPLPVVCTEDWFLSAWMRDPRGD
jgi:hypothetical protein